MGAYGEMAAQAGFNLASGLISNALAKKREEIARAENYKYGEMAAQKADQRTRKLYAELQSPEALLKQYKEAGLSPSLMFGNGGSQGATPAQGAQSAGGSGITPTTFGVNPVNLAQIELMNAQTRKTNAEADTEEGTNQRGKAQINVLLEQAAEISAQTENLQADTAFKAIATEIEKLALEYKQETFWTDITKANEEVNLLVAEVNKANNEAAIDALELEKNKATFETQVQIVQQQLKSLIAETAESEEQKKYLSKITEQAAYEMQLDYYYAKIDGEKWNLEKQLEIWDRKFEKWWRNAQVKDWQEHYKQFASEQSLEIWKTKWHVLGGIATAGMIGAGKIASSKTVRNTKKK